MNRETLEAILEQIRFISDDHFSMTSDLYLLQQYVLKQLNEQKANESTGDTAATRSSKRKSRRKSNKSK